MNYEIGLSSKTIDALKGLGNFSYEKIEQIFSIFVRQTFLTGAMICVCFPLSILLFFLAMNYIKKEKQKGNDNFDLIFPVIFIPSLIMLSLFFAVLGFGLMAILNPQYYAINRIIEVIK